MVVMAITFESLHEILRSLYTEMMPLCNRMVVFAKAIGGIGALLFIGNRLWQAIARAEPIDVYPMLRPFALLICIVCFQNVVLGTLNAIMSPLVQGTNELFREQQFHIREYREYKDHLEDESVRRRSEVDYVPNERLEGRLQEMGIENVTLSTMWGEKAYNSVKRWVRNIVHSILETIFQSISLVIDTLRTFILIVLSILGPLVFGVSIFEGFQSTLIQWFNRYISIYLWLPVSDLFGAILSKIQVLILQKDIQALSDPDYIPYADNTVYVIFMLIGIIGYLSVPSVANFIISAGGMGSTISKPTGYAEAAGKGGAALGGALAGNIAGRLSKNKKK